MHHVLLCSVVLHSIHLEGAWMPLTKHCVAAEEKFELLSGSLTLLGHQYPASSLSSPAACPGISCVYSRRRLSLRRLDWLPRGHTATSILSCHSDKSFMMLDLSKFPRPPAYLTAISIAKLFNHFNKLFLPSQFLKVMMMLSI